MLPSACAIVFCESDCVFFRIFPHFFQKLVALYTDPANKAELDALIATETELKERLWQRYPALRVAAAVVPVFGAGEAKRGAEEAAVATRLADLEKRLDERDKAAEKREKKRDKMMMELIRSISSKKSGAARVAAALDTVPHSHSHASHCSHCSHWVETDHAV